MKENAIQSYFDNVIVKSWTWARLTEEEKQRFVNMPLWVFKSANKGTTEQRQEKFTAIYDAFLYGIGCNSHNWRETEETPLF